MFVVVLGSSIGHEDERVNFIAIVDVFRTSCNFLQDFPAKRFRPNAKNQASQTTETG